MESQVSNVSFSQRLLSFSARYQNIEIDPQFNTTSSRAVGDGMRMQRIIDQRKAIKISEEALRSYDAEDACATSVSEPQARFQALSHFRKAVPEETSPPVFALFSSLERAAEKQLVIIDLVNVCATADSPGLRNFTEFVGTLIRDLIPTMELHHWIWNPALIPSPQYFENPIVQWPFDTASCLICYYITAMRNGFENLSRLLLKGGVLSSGKGVFTALAVACSGTQQEFYENSEFVLRASFGAGVVHQQHADQLAPILGTTRQTFALLVVNVPIQCLQLILLQGHNEALEGWTPEGEGERSHILPLSEVHITRVLSSRAAVVTGHPIDLLRVEHLLCEFGDATGVKVHLDYLPSRSPLNSQFFNQPLKFLLLRMWQSAGLLTHRLKFQVPFFSPVNGSEWSSNETQDLMCQLAAAVTCMPQDLTCALQHMRPTDRMLDFGMGRIRVGQLISWTKKSIIVIAEPQDIRIKSALPTPRRSFKRSVREKTFAKCAILNEVLAAASWHRKPREICAGKYTSLHCTFFEMNLLLDADEAGSDSINMKDNPFSPPHTPSTLSLAPGSPMAFTFESLAPLVPSSSVEVQCTSPAVSGRRGSGEVLVPLTQYVPINSPVGVTVSVFRRSPFIRYLELQNRGVLTQGAVDVASRLSRATGLDFPPHTLLMCPSVFALLELWDTLEFMSTRWKLLKIRLSEQVLKSACESLSSARERERRLKKSIRSLTHVRSTDALQVIVNSPLASSLQTGASSPAPQALSQFSGNQSTSD